VTHHIEEIPIGTTHALLLKDGKALAQGSLLSVLTSENLSALYGISIDVQNLAGRFFARAI
jgi:iron complex transport system ATP-binding protein